MDLVLGLCDQHVLTPHVYPESWPETDPLRQFLSLFAITTLGGVLVYLPMATLSYFFLFDHKLKKHPKFLPNQVALEIQCSLSSAPLMALPTAMLFWLEVRGYSKLYDDAQDHGGWSFLGVSVLAFLLFTDCFIYWIHRFLHHPIFYGPLHKLHHKWKVPTPFASHAFHPIDGFMQSLPYHVYPFLFPLHKVLYLALFVFVNVWTVSIHDGLFMVPEFLKPIINGSAHHTDHHLFFNVNYGQYFTLWDRIGGSFENPSGFTSDNVHTQVAASEEKSAAKSASRTQGSLQRAKSD